MRYIEIPHVFFEKDGQLFSDFTLLTDTYGGNFGEGTTAIVSPEVYKKLLNPGSGFYSQTVVPQKSAITMATPYKYAAQDLRNNYMLKRNLDAGDYNVFSTEDIRNYGSNYFTNVYVYAPMKLIVAIFDRYDHTQNYPEMAVRQMAQEYFGRYEHAVPDSFFITENHIDRIELKRLKYSSEAWGKLLDGSLKKPCVLDSMLQVNTDNKLTVDILKMVYTIGNKEWSKEAEKNFLIQLNVLNQYDWRCKKGTVACLLSMLNYTQGRYNRSIFSEITRCPSRYPKQIKELIECARNGSFEDDKDRELCTEFLCDLLKIKTDGMIVRMSEYLTKCYDNHVPWTAMYELFGPVVRIMPKYLKRNDA